MDPRVSLIMPVYNNLKYTKRILEEIDNKTREPNYLVIIDNASTDGTKEFLQEYGKGRENVCIIYNETNVGVTHAWNQGLLTFPDLEYFCVMNNDLLLVDDWLSKLIEILDASPKLGILSPFPLDPSACLEDKFEDNAQRYMLKHADSDSYDGLQGCCYILRKEMIDRIGKFDDQFVMIANDLDICVRAERAGYETRIIHNVVVFHYGCQTQSLFSESYRNSYYRDDMVTYFKKWGWPKGKITINSGKVRPI